MGSVIANALRSATTCMACIFFQPSLPAHAYDLPPVNLGLTGIMDGGAPAGPGWYFQQYIQHYGQGTLLDGNGDELQLPTEDFTFEKHKVEVTSALTQLVFQSDKPLLGGKWGVDFILPSVLNFDVDPDDSLALQANSGGLGDILIGPFIQWGPVMGPKGPRFMHRIEMEMIFPTGKYSDRYELNPGSNHFSFNPYWAGTYFLRPRWTTSWRLHYLWNDKNKDPSMRTRAAIQMSNSDLPVDDIRAGQAVHANLTSSYEVIPKRLRLGIGGYALRQITDTEVDGEDVKGRRERVYAVGPVGVYHFSQDTHLFLNAYHEFGTENRSEGDRFVLRVVHHF
ncbi:MAG: transporter [Halioglobus sp.]